MPGDRVQIWVDINMFIGTGQCELLEPADSEYNTDSKNKN